MKTIKTFAIGIAVIITFVGMLVLLMPIDDLKNVTALLNLIGALCFAQVMLILVLVTLSDDLLASSKELGEQKQKSYESYLHAERYIEAVKRISAGKEGFNKNDIEKSMENLKKLNWKP